MAHSQSAKEPVEEFLNILCSLGYRIVNQIFLEFVPKPIARTRNAFLGVIDSLVGETTENTQSSVKVSHHHSTVQIARKINSHSPRSPTVSPLLGSSVVSSTCDHNGGIVSSIKDGIKVIIPKGTIKEENSVTFSIAESLWSVCTSLALSS